MAYTEWETVGIPVTAGIDLLTPARLVEPKRALRLQNARWIRGKGVTRRRGHSSEKPRFRDLSAARVASYSAPAHPTFGQAERPPFDPVVSLPSTWLHGYGIFDTTQQDPTNIPSYPFSQERQPGILVGAARRNDENLVWDGFRFFSKTSSDWSGAGFYNAGLRIRPSTTLTGINSQRQQGDAVMPWCRAVKSPSSGLHQFYPDVADNGRIRATVFVTKKNVALDHSTMVNVQDSATGAMLQSDFELRATAGFQPAARAIPVGDYIHVFQHDFVGQPLRMFTLGLPSNGELPAWTSQTFGACDHFDFKKYDESRFAVVRVTAAGEMEVTEFLEAGTVSTTNFPANTVFSRGTGGLAQIAAIARAPQASNELCLTWRTAAGVTHARIYSSAGAALATAATSGVTTIAWGPNNHMTCEAQFLKSRGVGTSTPVFRTYYDGTESVGGAAFVISETVSISGAATVFSLPVAASASLGMLLASSAFRVGQRTYVWAFCQEGGSQHHYALLNDLLQPCGSVLRGQAIDTVSGIALATVNWYDKSLIDSGGEEPTPAKDFMVFHLGLTSSGILQEEKTEGRYVLLDFLPPLRSVTKGEVTYFPGAQMWAWDGALVSEAVPLSVPSPTITPFAGGSLVALATYQYRAYEAWTNAAGERVVGAATTLSVTLTGANQQVAFRFRPVVTRRPDAFYLLYRAGPIASSTTFNLISSVDPTSPNFLPANYDLYTLYTDTGATAGTEPDPANDPTLIPSFPAPSSEVIAVGAERIWVAGGEIEQGVVRASKTSVEREGTGFSPALQLLYNRGQQPITGMDFMGTVLATFTRDLGFIVDDTRGPNNTAQGSWPEPTKMFSNAGASQAEGIILLTEGLVFQSDEGIRMASPSGQLEEFGVSIDTLVRATKLVGAVQTTDDVRFFHRSGAYSWDMSTGAWSTWTGVGAVAVLPNGIVVREEGEVWTEADQNTDDGTPFSFVYQTAHLKGGSIGDYQRIRRIGYTAVELVSNLVDPIVRTYFDESAVQTDILVKTYNGEKLVRFRPSRQKCSVISIEIDDGAPVVGSFAITGIILEIGLKKGLDRVPWTAGA